MPFFRISPGPAIALLAFRLCLSNVSPEHRAARIICGLPLSPGFYWLTFARIAARLGRPLSLPDLDPWLPLIGEKLGLGLVVLAALWVASWCVEWLGRLYARQPNADFPNEAKLAAMPRMPAPVPSHVHPLHCHGWRVLPTNDREGAAPVIEILPETPEPLALDKSYPIGPAVVVYEEALCRGTSPRALCLRLGDSWDEFWIPRSVVLPGSELQATGDEGRLVIASWFARARLPQPQNLDSRKSSMDESS